ncbi:MAG TPA: Gfo/Idh/MocA family oxidoreductase [Candidatus Limivivens intestinipullorum]|uniref:Gfo/Idh/MocA family oxidoreductase n=1 Tax=Candidatus Limivivens intestinipullorum TaxID=2840858 RepID=A0A9D1EQM6_9FIRM|nr:Gfo/Idh/MocA family oxidoreductase [Candidatus Limivivens intestinipullorum]
MKKVNVALVGLGFGGFFSAIYQKHPNVGRLVLFDTDKVREENLCQKLGITERAESFEAILEDPDIDAVHLVTPFTLHEEQSVAVLNSGKHCACTVPMGLTLEGIRRIVQAQKASGKNYMMMETTLYTYPFFYAKGMLDAGEFGTIQFLRGYHYQDMAKWPDYWTGLPPMYYATHAIAPISVMAGARIQSVRCEGSGRMNPDTQKYYGNPYPVESAILEFENGLKGEVTRSLFETAREYVEGFDVYGSKKTFQWGFRDHDKPYVTTLLPPREGDRGGRCETEVVSLPDFSGSLPQSIRKFAVSGGDFDPLNPHKSWNKELGAGHHGAHPHLVHEFISSIVEERKPWIDEQRGANITAAGICAHQSAMEGGERVTIPEF